MSNPAAPPVRCAKCRGTGEQPGHERDLQVLACDECGGTGGTGETPPARCAHEVSVGQVRRAPYTGRHFVVMWISADTQRVLVGRKSNPENEHSWGPIGDVAKWTLLGKVGVTESAFECNCEETAS